MHDKHRWGRLLASASAAVLAGTSAGWLTAGGTSAAPPSEVVAPSVRQAQFRVAPGSAPLRQPSTDRVRPGSDLSVPLLVAKPALPPTPRTSSPTRLLVASQQIQMMVQPAGVTAGGEMELPEDPDVLGWYRYGPAPGSDSGAVVMAAHVDSATHGVGELAELELVRKGAVINVETTNGPVSYRVEELVQLDKKKLDTEWLFSRTGPARLHLVTCGGSYDRTLGQYSANVVLVARAIA